MANDLTKRLYVGNVEVWESDLSKKRFSDAVPDVKIVERGIILPARRIDNVYRGGVCDDDFNFVAGYSQKANNKGGDKLICVTSSYPVEREEIVQLDEDVIFGGSLQTNAMPFRDGTGAVAIQLNNFYERVFSSISSDKITCNAE